jgi:hypothetical protein
MYNEWNEVEVDFIPAGYTSCLQVLDKGVNKPFNPFKQLNGSKLHCKVQNPTMSLLPTGFPILGTKLVLKAS